MFGLPMSLHGKMVSSSCWWHHQKWMSFCSNRTQTWKTCRQWMDNFFFPCRTKTCVYHESHPELKLVYATNYTQFLPYGLLKLFAKKINNEITTVFLPHKDNTFIGYSTEYNSSGVHENYWQIKLSKRVYEARGSVPNSSIQKTTCFWIGYMVKHIEV